MSRESSEVYAKDRGPQGRGDASHVLAGRGYNHKGHDRRRGDAQQDGLWIWLQLLAEVRLGQRGGEVVRIKKKMTLEQRVIPMDRMAPEQALVAQRNPREWPKEYVVKKMLGSTEPAVWDVLSKEEVDRYCGDENWEVIIQ